MFNNTSQNTDIQEVVVPNGETVFDNNCAVCHSKENKHIDNLNLVVTPRNLSQSLLTKEQIALVVKNGSYHYGSHKETMPSFKEALKDDEIDAVADYIVKNLNKKSLEEADRLYDISPMLQRTSMQKYLKDGEKIYQKRCAFCHGTEAKGDGIASKIPENSINPYNLTKTILTDKQKFLIVKYGISKWGGAKEDMPSWGNSYDDLTIKSIIAYLNTLK